MFAFIPSIAGNLSIFTEQDPDTVYPSQSVIWDRFEQAFRALWGLVTYAPVFRDYYYQGLQEFYLDNVMYVELRCLLPEVHQHQSCCVSPRLHSPLTYIFVPLPQLYELDGSTYDLYWALKTYQDVTRQFTAEHPDFFGTRIIFTVHRCLDLSGVNESAVNMTIAVMFPSPLDA